MRIFNHLAKLLVVATVLLIGCETDQLQTLEERDAAAIHMVIEKLTDAYVDRDWDRFAGFFDQDAIWMPPGAAPLSGEEAWWAWVQAWWDASTVVDIGVTTEELIISGDWAIERHSDFPGIIHLATKNPHAFKI